MPTLVVMVLVVGGTIQHTKDFQNVAVALIAVKLVSRAVEAQYEFSRTSSRIRVQAHSA